MRKIVALLLALFTILMVTAFAEEFDVATWDESITQKFANTAYTEKYPFTFYKVVAKEHSFTYSDGSKGSYIARYSSFDTGEAKLFKDRIDYDLHKRGFTIAFNANENSSTIKDFFTLTLMVVFDLKRERAEEFTAQIVPTYDGETRSEFVYSEESVVYLQGEPELGTTSIVMIEREYYKDIRDASYPEMDYKSLTAFLNRGELGSFTGEVTRIEKGAYVETVFAKLKDGNIVEMHFRRETYTKPFIYKVGSSYKFYISIQKGSSLWKDGDIIISGAHEVK